jgi:hypothetical protein
VNAAPGEYFRIIREGGNVLFQRAVGGTAQIPPLKAAWQTIHEEIGARSMSGLYAVYSLYSPGQTMRGLFWTPGLTTSPPPLRTAGAEQIFGAVNPATQKSITFTNDLGLLCGFVPGRTYTSTASAPTVSFSSDQPLTVGGFFPSLNIFVNNLPISTFNGRSGRVEPIIASINKNTLSITNDGLQLLYENPAPYPLACRFANETAVDTLEIEVRDSDGNRATLSGRSSVVLIFSNSPV